MAGSRLPRSGLVSFAASREQRLAVKDATCAYCGREGVDPAHLCPRSLGGCDDRLCVVGLCRLHHNAYDTGRLDIYTVVTELYPEQYAHMVEHLGEQGAEWRLRNERPV